MQNKNLLLPLLGAAGAILAIVGLFLGAWSLVSGGEVVEVFTFFSGFEGAESQLEGFVENFASIWATLSMISLIVGILAVIVNVVLKLMQKEAASCNILSKVLSWVAIVAILAFVVFGIMFTSMNSGSLGEGESLVRAGFNFGIGYWLGLIGLAFGTFFTTTGSCLRKGV